MEKKSARDGKSQGALKPKIFGYTGDETKII